MKKWKWNIFLLTLGLPMWGFSLDKLAEKYLIEFGDPQAPVQITEYFSMSCPHCLSLFKKDFKILKEKYLETKQAYWVFHPVPLDSLTVQTMDCLSKLTLKQKRTLLEALFDTLQVQDGPEVALFLLQEAMKLFDQPMPNLDEQAYIVQTEAFQAAFQFLKQEDRIKAVPSVEINAELYRQEIPNQAFIEKQMQARLSHG
ncbi:thioredoxin domain-containing protein [Candidatus Protochlamydia sp. R18]|uniref:thioredoxin domain-containing protein n=1 Tax=Candidatus Protochlamydia sp. R18 TaxID=1353977 RepID=UPI0005A61C0B|nr:thioredoxin domain-containing protein [Candidatus Protochlamydia sp. R18]